MASFASQPGVAAMRRPMAGLEEACAGEAPGGRDEDADRRLNNRIHGKQHGAA